MKAYWKDIFRTIKLEKKRFFSILLITFLGVTMFAGLSAGCRDLRASADRFYDEQKLYDIKIQSTFGLTDEDVEALSQVKEVAEAHGTYSETVLVQADDLQQKADVKLLDENGLSQPRLLDGTMPSKASEIAVSQNYCADTGKTIGDTVTLSPQNSEDADTTSALKQKNYTITAVMLDATDLIADKGAASFRSSQSSKYFFYVTQEALDNDVYSAVELRINGAEALSCFYEEYTDLVSDIKKRIEKEIKSDREQARYDSIIADAVSELHDAKDEAAEKFADADAQIADAKTELADSRTEICSGWQQLQDGMNQLQQQKNLAAQKFKDGYAELENGWQQLQSGKQQISAAKEELSGHTDQLTQASDTLKQQKQETLQKLSDAETKLTEGRTQAESGKEQIQAQISSMQAQFGDAWPQSAWEAYEASVTSGNPDADARAQVTEQLQASIDAVCAQLNGQLELLDPSAEDYETQKATLEAQIAQIQQIPSGLSQLLPQYETVSATLVELDTQAASLKEQKQQALAQFDSAETQLQAQSQQLDAAKEQLQQQEQKLQTSETTLTAGLKELQTQEQNATTQFASADQELQKTKDKLTQAEQELKDGSKELEEQIQKLEEERAKADDKFAEAQADIDAIDRTKWYVQDRSSVGSYTTIQSDADSIETIGNVFPILFLSVAILISLTTITRLVEEERGQIGIYKALGFSDRKVYGKYLIYTLSACICGGLLGDIGGFILLPKFLFMVFDTMYKIPSYTYLFHAGYGISGILLFVTGGLFAAVCACHSELKQCPLLDNGGTVKARRLASRQSISSP